MDAQSLKKTNKEELIEDSEQNLQKTILEGKEVLIKDPSKKQIKVGVRFNNKDTDGETKWILLLNGNEFFAKEIIIYVPTITETIQIEGVGIKHQIACQANEIKFKNNIARIN